MPGRLAGSVFVRQKEGGRAAVPFGDDPEAVVAVALAGLRRVDGIGREYPVAARDRRVVAPPILVAHAAPVAAHMALEALEEVVRRAGGSGPLRGDRSARMEQGRLLNAARFLRRWV
jgi:hypothetical protein